VRLAEKLRHLRLVEGTQRGYGRALTKAEVSRLMRQVGRGLSAAYLSQLESGTRSHMTEHTRALLATFFKVHPGYLVSDPADFETELQTHLPSTPRSADRLEDWLAEQAESWRDDPLVGHVLLKIRRQPQPRGVLEALDRLLDLPADRLRQVVGDAVEQSVGRRREQSA
jgi:transcriptional regulator with XRE-family HTH domain